jgi:hypothetical protein
MSALLSGLALGLVIPMNLFPLPQEEGPIVVEERVTTVHTDRPDTLLGHDEGPPPIRLGFFISWSTLDGKIEKENSSTGLGSGGDKLKMQTDLNFDEWSPVYGLEFVLEANSNLRLRAAVHGSQVEGTRLLIETQRHDGNLFLAGETLDSRLTMGFADLELHFLPRQQNRRFNELDLLVGVRAFNIKSRLRSDGGTSASEHTAGAYPRFGVRGLIGFGRGLYLNLNGAIGGWAIGSQDSYYTAADFELNAALGLRIVDHLEIEAGYSFHTFGTYQEQHHDLEQVSFTRHGFRASFRVTF